MHYRRGYSVFIVDIGVVVIVDFSIVDVFGLAGPAVVVVVFAVATFVLIVIFATLVFAVAVAYRPNRGIAFFNVIVFERKQILGFRTSFTLFLGFSFFDSF